MPLQRMDIESLVVGGGPLASLVVLRSQGSGEDGTAAQLPIQIGSFEASAISMGVAPREGGRPMTHDLLKSTISALGASCVSVRINDVKGTTFYAQVELMREDGRQVLVDARPSDAIALALRMRSLIYVYENILNENDMARHMAERKHTPEEDMQALQKKLDKAVKNENFELAIKLRDIIKELTSKKDNPEE